MKRVSGWLPTWFAFLCVIDIVTTPLVFLRGWEANPIAHLIGVHWFIMVKVLATLLICWWMVKRKDIWFRIVPCIITGALAVNNLFWIITVS